MRAAVYYAPPVADRLWIDGCSWLGRDPERAVACPQPDIAGLADLTAEPRRYGLHATLKPPMRLRTAYGDFLHEAAALAKRSPSFDLPPLAVSDLRGFLALRETSPCPPLHALADACVEGLDAHRAPAEPEELARRRGRGLPAEQEAMLVRWGYPHVFGTWFFHMTLTHRLDAGDMARVRPLAESHFAAALAVPRRVEWLTVFTQVAPGAPFLVAERLPLGGS